MLLELTAQMRKSKRGNSQMLLVTISQKFVLNFQLNFLKGKKKKTVYSTEGTLTS